MLPRRACCYTGEPNSSSSLTIGLRRGYRTLRFASTPLTPAIAARQAWLRDPTRRCFLLLTPYAPAPALVPFPAPSWSSGAEGCAALLYHWDTGVLEVVYEALDPATLTFSLAAPGARRVGGPLRRPPAPGEPLALRVFLDYSLLEVFTGEGEVLTTRVYRGAGEGSGLELISVDGPTRVLHAAAFEVRPAFGGEDGGEEVAGRLRGLPLPHEVVAAAMVGALPGRASGEEAGSEGQKAERALEAAMEGLRMAA